MTARVDAPSRTPPQLLKYAAAVLAVWTAAVAASLLWAMHAQHLATLEVARAQARAAHEKDILYRRWNASHGGVYAPVTDETPPNPYLDVPEGEITTPSGRHLTLINPAYMTRQVHEIGVRRNGVHGHITSLNPLRPENAPDAWEAAALEAFERGVDEVTSVELIAGEEHMRLMRPLLTEKSCLGCHAMQSYQVGSIQGGISEAVSMGPLWAISRVQMTTAYVGHGMLWLIGAAGIYTGTRRLSVRIRERNLAEEDLHRAHTETKQLLEAIPSMLICVDASGTVVVWNRVAETLLEVDAEDAVGMLLSDLPVSWDTKVVDDAVDRCRAANRHIRLDELRYKHVDGTGGFLGIMLTPLCDETGHEGSVLLIAADVTDRQVLEGQLVQAQKLESIGQLAAGIAHEINTPAQYVGDNTRFLRDGVGDLLKALDQCNALIVPADDAPLPHEEQAERFKETLQELDVAFLREEIPKAIEQSLEGLDRVTGIVRAMKNFSHPDGDEKEAVDLNKAIESTVTVARNEWKYVADLAMDFNPDLPLVPCFAGDFNQVVLNIVVNAAHAIADVVGKNSGEKGTITISTLKDGDWAEIRIRDTGAGIKPEHRSKVFDHFFTTKAVGKGTGQGLSLAYSVITEKHGGTLTLESETGRGTTFIIRLPLAASLKATAEEGDDDPGR